MEKWFPPSGWVGAGGAGCEERGVYSLPPLQTQPLRTLRIWNNMTRKEGSLDAKASHGRVDMHRAGWEWVWGEFKSGKLKRKVLASANVVCLLLLIFCWHEQWVSGGESSLASCLITPLSQSHAEPSETLKIITLWVKCIPLLQNVYPQEMVPMAVVITQIGKLH